MKKVNIDALSEVENDNDLTHFIKQGNFLYENPSSTIKTREEEYKFFAKQIKNFNYSPESCSNLLSELIEYKGKVDGQDYQPLLKGLKTGNADFGELENLALDSAKHFLKSFKYKEEDMNTFKIVAGTVCGFLALSFLYFPDMIGPTSLVGSCALFCGVDNYSSIVQHYFNKKRVKKKVKQAVKILKNQED